jgi:hypothetical protein
VDPHSTKRSSLSTLLSTADYAKNDVNFVLSVLSLEELGARGNKGLALLVDNPVHSAAIAGLATSATAQATIEVRTTSSGSVEAQAWVHGAETSRNRTGLRCAPLVALIGGDRITRCCHLGRHSANCCTCAVHWSC